MMKNSFKNIFSFEFWQKFGKALMVVVAGYAHSWSND